MAKLSVRDIDVNGKEVLMRADFNVPLNDQLQITDETRIQGALPTIELLINAGAKLVLCSHLGRPSEAKEAEFSLRPVAARLAELLETKVVFAEDTVGEFAKEARAGLEDGDIVLLENTRYAKEETANDEAFSKALAGDAEFFVNDAFGTAHRAHASTEGVTHFVKQSAMGLLVEKELEFLQAKLESPERPFLAIMGGKKVADKIQVIKAMMEKADEFIIGGAMAYTFLKAQGYKVGDSLVQEEFIDLAKELLALAESKGIKFHLPVDTRVTQEFSNTAETRVTVPYAEGGGVEDGWEGIDIGDKSIEHFATVINNAKTVIWNGPMGVFEMENFAKGTKEVAHIIAKADAMTIIGGGDSVTAANAFCQPSDFDFLSTGGGASLELLEGKTLPGVAALTDV